MARKKTLYYLIDMLILSAQIFMGIVVTVNLFSLFQQDFYRMTLIVIMALLIFGLSLLKDLNAKRMAHIVAKELSYKTAEQVVYDLQSGEIVCYILDDDYGTLKMIEDNDLVLFAEKHESTLHKKFEHNEELLAFIRQLMTITNLYKNGVLFTAEILEIENADDYLAAQEKAREE